jgi:antitoxin component YwqK of YwqJK toxin-antitoxin module
MRKVMIPVSAIAIVTVITLSGVLKAADPATEAVSPTKVSAVAAPVQSQGPPGTILAGLCLLTACVTKGQVKSDRERDDLAGSVHVIRTEKNFLLGEKALDQKTEISQVTYYEKGNKAEETKCKGDGSLVNRSIFDYDTGGRLTAVTVFAADGSVRLKKTYKYVNTAEGRTIEEAVYKDGNTLITKAITAYDKKARATEFATLDPNGKPGLRQVISYNVNGKQAEIDYFQDSNSLSGKAVFVYDAQGNLIGENIYGADGSQTGRMVFGGDTERGADVTITEYDSNGALVSKKNYVREFDPHGNWTKETKSELNLQSSRMEPVEVTRREITYY